MMPRFQADSKLSERLVVGQFPIIRLIGTWQNLTLSSGVDCAHSSGGVGRFKADSLLDICLKRRVCFGRYRNLQQSCHPDGGENHASNRLPERPRGCIFLRIPFGFSGNGTVNTAGQLRVQSGVQRSELRYTQLRIARPMGVLRNEHGSQDRYASSTAWISPSRRREIS